MAAEIIPYIFYQDVPKALDWLARAFGFTEHMRVGTPSGGMHAEMLFEGRKIMMGQGAKDWRMMPPGPDGDATQGVFVYLKASTLISSAPRPPAPRSSRRSQTTATAAPIRSAISTAIPGTSPKLRAEGASDGRAFHRV
jgi:hypothetical protein